jgi:hypothetical protein
MRIEERTIRLELLAMITALILFYLSLYLRSMGISFFSGFAAGLVIGYIAAEESILKSGLTIQGVKIFSPKKERRSKKWI